MGLDQYLLAKVSNKEKLAQLKTEATGACGGLFPLTIKTHGKAEIGYWRKWYKLNDYLWGLLRDTTGYKNYLAKEIAYQIDKYSNPDNIQDTWYETKAEVLDGIKRAGSVETYVTAKVLANRSSPNCEPIRIPKRLVKEIIQYAKDNIEYYKTPEGIEDSNEECFEEWDSKATEETLREYLEWTIKDWEGVVKTFTTALELMDNYNASIYYEVWY